MANAIIVFSETLKRWIEPRRDDYRFATEAPHREGDEAVIIVAGKRVHVMLERASSGHFWLVDLTRQKSKRKFRVVASLLAQKNRKARSGGPFSFPRHEQHSALGPPPRAA